jgi:hypothetical protein
LGSKSKLEGMPSPSPSAVSGFASFAASRLAATSDAGSKALWALPLSNETGNAAEAAIALSVFQIFRISACYRYWIGACVLPRFPLPRFVRRNIALTFDNAIYQND